MAKGIDGTFLLVLPQYDETQIFKLSPDKPELLNTLDVGAPVRFTSDSRYLFVDRERVTCKFSTGRHKRQSTIHRFQTILMLVAMARFCFPTPMAGQILIWDAKALLPSQPVAIQARGKQHVIFEAVKQNQLLQNFPNPFNPETWIPFRLANESDVTIRIYSSTGQLVRRLSPGIMPAGDYASESKAIYWDGRNQMGESVSSGVYLYTINAGDFSATRKMLICK